MAAHCSSNPRNDFRSISLLPEKSDLLQHDDIFLRPNIINGGYSSVDHYLDVQFRLLREDFLDGLREGIQSYLRNKWQGSHDNIRVFKDVKFLKLKDDLDKTGYLVQLQRKEIQNRKSDNDMFMFGSLLVFTFDNFKNVLISTVMNSDYQLLEKGQIIVTIPDDHFHQFSVEDIYMKNYIMIESEVYFEPYYHVLKALQHQDLARNFPMKKYIVDAKDHTAPPWYLNRFRNNFTTGTASLNQSQCDAYKMALTREFVVIQGPPGTGKTHLGLKVAKAVLTNGNTVMPMLVICFTNHALDQFLEGLLKVTDDIVRIGGRSKSEKLEGYNLSKLRKDNKIKMLSFEYHSIIKPLKSTVQELVEIEESLKSDRCSEDMGNDLVERFTELLVQYKIQVQKYRQYQMEKDKTLLRNTRVIGMTTTGAARLQPLLRSLQAPVVIVEEAAEVLEAHIIASLTEHCKHLILIGDHKQLQPSSASYILGKKYNLEISLFERMIANGIHSRTLTVQHRMRPEISALIAPAIYEDLRNHPSVEFFPPVKGLKKNVYFVNHKVHEDTKRDNDTSHSNRHEAQFLIRLVIYLLQKGYEAEEITILVTYKGQMVLLKDLARKHEDMDEVLITTVDSYQGEENKIILLSLVRCNKSNSIGFLARENRVCVALSRAREGFYLIGNMDALRNKSGLWKKIEISLKQQDAVGPALPLMCHLHPHIVTMVSVGKDFDKIKDGRCRQSCGVVMKCSHICNMLCHEYDREHTVLKCLEPCKRKICHLQHPCPKQCYEMCSACVVMVIKQLLCDHRAKLPCHQPVDKAICRQSCKRHNAQCKVENVGDRHMCRKLCFQDCDPCPVIVAKQSKNCPHLLTLQCHQEPWRNLCEEKCTRLLTCGHHCAQDCSEECEVPKKRSYCNHIVKVACHESPDKTKCGKKCDRSYCGHKCVFKCFEECICFVMVTKQSRNCPHLLTLRCCDAPLKCLCIEKCTRSLLCSHPCTQDCREECDATLCQVMVASIAWMKLKNMYLVPCNIKQRGIFSNSFLSYSCNSLLSTLFRKCARQRFYRHIFTSFQYDLQQIILETYVKLI